MLKIVETVGPFHWRGIISIRIRTRINKEYVGYTGYQTSLKVTNIILLNMYNIRRDYFKPLDHYNVVGE
jgi:hypothetical protein